MENTPTASSSKSSSLAGLLESTLSLSLVKTRDEDSASDMSDPGNPHSGRSSLDHSHRPPSRVISQTKTEQVNVNQQSSRPSSLFVDRPLVISPSRDRSPSEVIRVLKDSVFDSDSDTSTPSQPSRPLQPRQPTGAEWNPKSRSPVNSESDVVSFHEVLKDLDKQEETRKKRTLQLEHWSLLSQPVSWDDTAQSVSHLWVERETREACHLHETQFCRDQKLLHQKRTKVGCSACRILVHTSCIRQLYYCGIVCKPSFREIKQKVKDITVNHHFLQRRKMAGKCVACKKGFGNWKKYSGRTFEGVSCSWCGDGYHLGCFVEKLKDEPCHMGPLRNMIIPPSWIIKLPRFEQEQTAITSGTGSTERKKKRSTRRRTKRNSSTSEDKTSKNFTVKPLGSSHNKPLLVFINPKSGGNQGSKIIQTLQWLLNPRQIFDLSIRGPEFGLQMFRNLPNFRILACGGDGTAGWILSVLDRLDIKPLPAVAVLPLGTGNDLARVLDWGGSYADEPLDNILMHVQDGPVVELDRWVLSVWPNEEVSTEDWRQMEGKDDVPLHVINNYFSIGADAQVALEFHEGREANPQKYSNRFVNKYTYSKVKYYLWHNYNGRNNKNDLYNYLSTMKEFHNKYNGFYFLAIIGSSFSRYPQNFLSGVDLLTRKFANLTDHIKLVGDGIDLTPMIRQLRLEAICFLNITSYGSGCNPWGTPVATPGQRIGPQSMSDGMIEIVGFWASTFPKLLLGAHGERIAHCQHIKLYTYASLPVQIDGEACKIKPSIVEVVYQNKALMVKKAPLRESRAPLRGVGASHQLKVSVSKVTLPQYESLHSDLHEIRKAALGLGLVVTTPGECLRKLRPQINRFTIPKDFEQNPRLSKKWQYLDVASSGRSDRVFQILPEQEEGISVGDMLCDGILIVEYEDLSGDMSLEGDDDDSLAKRSGSLDRTTVYNIGQSSDTSDSELVEHSKTRMSPINEEKSLAVVPTIQQNKSDTNITVDSNGDTSVGTGLSPLPTCDLSSDSQSDSESGTNLSGNQKALFDSVKRGNVVKMKDLHEKGAKLAHVDSNGLTPLHHAARLGRKEVVKYIVDNIPREALDLQDEDKAQTALHKAAWYGYRGICKILVEANASLLRTDYQGNTPYLKSMESEDAKLQEYLRKREIEQKMKIDGDEAVV